ncbi:DUF6691 family protein [Alcanivorax sp. 24]|uniref:DUF6691 family protein n=1 Tax=Alcanivorax sp. 24 TaxID=2545266 RepID=UPI0010610559|nr:DUF6691 family protein [Alcanivorax sp. 24]
MNKLTALLAGLLFGLGLILSGMTDPAKVLGFLDLAGAWDPSLALVMVGAIAAAVVPMALARRRSRAWLGGAMRLPSRRDIDRRLIGGSLVFGVGWGLAGICPGPALTLLPLGYWQGIVFVVAMVAGMVLFRVMESRGRG